MNLLLKFQIIKLQGILRSWIMIITYYKIKLYRARNQAALMENNYFKLINKKTIR